MNEKLAIAVSCLFLSGCDQDVQKPEPRPIEENADADYFSKYGAFGGDLSFDAAKDELESIIDGMVQRNDQLVAQSGFCAVDAPNVRANIVILTFLLEKFGGHGNEVTDEQFESWTHSVSQCFEDPKRWGFRPWPESEKKAWRIACEKDFTKFREVIQRLRAE